MDLMSMSKVSNLWRIVGLPRGGRWLPTITSSPSWSRSTASGWNGFDEEFQRCNVNAAGKQAGRRARACQRSLTPSMFSMRLDSLYEVF